MLNTQYDSQDAIPENKRGAYVQQGDKWMLDDLATDHPLLVHARQLKTEKTEAQAKAAGLETELANAKSAPTVPRGHVAVPKIDAELLDKYRPLGTPEELTTIKTEHGTLKGKVEAQDKRAKLTAVAQALGWNEHASEVLQLLNDLPEIELRAAQNDKGEMVKSAIAQVQGADNVVTEKPFLDYFTEQHAALLPAVTVNGQRQTVSVPGQTGNSGMAGKDAVAARLAAQAAAAKANPNPLQRPLAAGAKA